MTKPTIFIEREIGDDEIPPKGHLRIADIKVLPEMQQRATVMSIEDIEKPPPKDWLEHLTNKLWVSRYQKMLTVNDPPPVTVYQVEHELILVDGFHRLYASIKAGRATIPAIVMEGTKKQAYLGSCQANSYDRNYTSSYDEPCAFFTLYHYNKKYLNKKVTEIAGFFSMRDNKNIRQWLSR
ncbi:MAG: ParB/RepB/Spo0J family partition protein [Actinomycetota bacterium]